MKLSLMRSAWDDESWSEKKYIASVALPGEWIFHVCKTAHGIAPLALSSVYMPVGDVLENGSFVCPNEAENVIICGGKQGSTCTPRSRAG